MKTHIRLILICVIATLAFTSCKKEPPAGTGSQPLDYALQVIPDIHEVMPKDLIIAMDTVTCPFSTESDHLYFGDNPPKVITPFYIDSLYLTRFIHNTDYNPNSTYNKASQSFDNSFSFAFFGQHRGVSDAFSFVRDYRYEPQLNGAYFHEYANKTKEVFIMGEDPYFTAYFTQVQKREVGDANLAQNISDYDIEMTQSIIISGKVTPNGIEHFRMGMRFESYNYASPNQGIVGIPEIHDIFVYDANGIMSFDTDYDNIHLGQ